MLSRVQGLNLAIAACYFAACGSADLEEADLFSGMIPHWGVSDAPIAVVGGYREEAGQPLSNVRGGILLPSGLLAVADGHSREIRLYTSDGSFTGSAGGRGAGPGEFASLSAVAHGPGGGFCGWDSQLARLSCFDSDASFLSSASPDLSNARQFRPKFLGLFPDGSFVLQDSPSDMERSEELTREHRDTLHFLRFAAEGKPAGVLATAPGAEAFFLNKERVWGSKPIIFGRASFAHLDGDYLFVGTNDSVDIRAFAADGDMVLRVEHPTRPRPVDPRWVDAARDSLRRKLEADATRLAQHVGEEDVKRITRVEGEHISLLPHRRTLPAFSSLRAAHDGTIWLESPEEPYAVNRSWLVLNWAGEPVGRVDIPADAQVLDVGSDLIVLLTRDLLDVETVSIHRLVKAG